jgi:hypothetical protein
MPKITSPPQTIGGARVPDPALTAFVRDCGNDSSALPRNA